VREYLQGTGPDYIDHENMLRLNKAILDVFEPKHPYAFFTICSWAKPYSASYIHKGIRRGLRKAGVLDKVDYIHISSAGVIPADAELWACFYDWSNDWIQDEITFKLLQKRISERLAAFLEKFQYQKCFYYVRPGSNTIKAIDEVVHFIDFCGLGRWVDAPRELWKHIYIFPTSEDIHKPYQLTTEQEKELEEEIRADLLRPDPDDVLAVPSIIGAAAQKIRKELDLDE